LFSYYHTQQGGFDFRFLLNAIDFAATKHEGQYREGVLATPYIVHPLRVAQSLWMYGNIRDVSTLLAALLHDTLEDTTATGEEIENHFSLQVRSIVEELTDNLYLSSEEKRQKQIDHALYLSFNAKFVKLAAQLYNIRDLKNLLPAERLKNTNYLYWGFKLLNALKGINEPLERILEIEIQSQLSEDLSISR
jgi:guanosine-3',5'-bis(diphosphate) 3'-pyrophosphohydrolase